MYTEFYKVSAIIRRIDSKRY
ncbi:hypothetical protein [Sporofaciens sp. JLR.KK001]